MTTEQMLHIGMINSFNIITGRNSFNEILDSGVSMFAHNPQRNPDYNVVALMIEYFASVDMFEECSEIRRYIDSNYDISGNFIENECDCPQPKIGEYKAVMHCLKCKKILKYG